MSDEFQLGSGNWWKATRNRFESSGTTTVPAPISTTLNAIATFGGSNMVLHGGNEQSGGGGGGGGGGVLGNPNLQMMGLGLSSQGVDWNQTLIRSERNFLQREIPTASSHEHWRQKLYSAGASSDDSSANDSTTTSQHNNLSTTTYNQMDSSAAAYGLLLSENQPTYENRPINNYNSYPPSSYGSNVVDVEPFWNKFPPFMRSWPPKQADMGSHLHFTNNIPLWNASGPVSDAQSGFLPAISNSIPTTPSLDEKPKITSEILELGRTTAKKNSGEMSSKRPRKETPTPLPAFKVRKEKMGDRITALQQLVSPFGKTDTASVLSEAIEYIKFLHEQVGVLSTPYMKNGGPIQHQQSSDNSNLDLEGTRRQDLRSRGLCLVPVSSTFPVTHETTVDFWTPTFGGTFR